MPLCQGPLCREPLCRGDPWSCAWLWLSRRSPRRREPCKCASFCQRMATSSHGRAAGNELLRSRRPSPNIQGSPTPRCFWANQMVLTRQPARICLTAGNLADFDVSVNLFANRVDQKLPFLGSIGEAQLHNSCEQWLLFVYILVTSGKLFEPQCRITIPCRYVRQGATTTPWQISHSGRRGWP